MEDRGLDNWMIKICWHNHGDDDTHTYVNGGTNPGTPTPDGKNGHANRAPFVKPVTDQPLASPALVDLRNSETLSGSRAASPRPGTPNTAAPHIHIGAIDNSLAFPWKHPDEWRSFPLYFPLSNFILTSSGWLFLPVSLIGQPFSQRTRDHFIPLLTSKKWWQETTKLLHTLFDKDVDFQERMFARQLAVLKGQAWNILETLKQPDQGPLELCRRQRVLVNDEEMEVPVAVPMTVPTSRPPQFHEEMDISSLGQASSAPPPQIRLSRTPEAASRALDPISDPYDADIARSSLDEFEVPGRLSNVEDLLGSFLSEDLNPPKHSKHGYFKKSRNRMSYEGPSRPLLPSGRRRGYSLSETGGLLDEEEEERDLGFAAAQDEEGLRRKVIVEK